MIKYAFLFSVFFVFAMALSSFDLVYADKATGKSGWVVMSDKVCGDKLCSEVDYVESMSSSIAYFSPPLKRIFHGAEPSDVTCTEGKVLVLKQSNGLPACVNPSSVAKLITRGWAVHFLSESRI